ncbi:hypothetical protein J437_LFUL011260 [Ladona fulva]|uniref:Sugar phosphate transporter domain-containing protein n=1 Tax=Ladona fulva TaxID=123851 RepID=A0A8K0P3P0_LADFU|nr:hypothetical protein J437_LFUL011260 [Ladona fulva]
MEDNERKGKTIPYFIFNAVCSIVIILINKWIYVHVGFPNLTLTFIHFSATFLGLLICQHLKVFEVKYAPFLDLLPLALTFCGFVYAIIVRLIAVKLNAFGHPRERPLRANAVEPGDSFVPGIESGTAKSVTNEYNMVGQLKFCLTLLGAFLLFKDPLHFNQIIGIILTVIGVIFYSHFKGMVLASGCIAFFVNLSIYWIIGNTSPLTYNMVGHLKFCLTLLGAFLLFEDPLHFNQIIGITLTVAGVTLYAHVKLKEQSARTARTLEEGIKRKLIS